MYEHGVQGIDHPVIAVRNMEQARLAYQRLGFTIPPRGSHVEWGTGNWCVMFTDDYLELRGIVDSSRPLHGLDRFLERGEGLMGIALATNDVAASRTSLIATGLNPGAVRELSRNFELPGGWLQPRFALSLLPADDTPGLASVVLCQHLTPELLRRPEWLAHSNGALRVIGLTVPVTRLDPVVSAYERLFGSAFRANGNSAEVRLGRTVLRFAPRDGPAKLHIGVSDLTVTRRTLHDNKVPYTDAVAALAVLPDDACGVAVEFVELACQ